MIRNKLAFLALLCFSDSALACSPLPEGWAAKMAKDAAAKVGKRRTSFVEAVVERGATWPDVGALRVVRSHWGKLRPGAVIHVRPQPGSMCGPGGIVVGQRGFLQLADSQLQQRPLPFYGFMSKLELDAYRQRRLVVR